MPIPMQDNPNRDPSKGGGSSTASTQSDAPASGSAPSTSGSSTGSTPLQDFPAANPSSPAGQAEAPKPVLQPFLGVETSTTMPLDASKGLTSGAPKADKPKQSDGTLVAKQERRADRRADRDGRLRELQPMPYQTDLPTTKMVSQGGFSGNTYYPPRFQPLNDEEMAARQEKLDKVEGRQAREMTWERYNKLSDEQRAAVDFNTMLVNAREKDMKNLSYDGRSYSSKASKYDGLTEDERTSYDAAVTEMFGETGGSQIFAPETIAVLRQLNWKPTKGELGSDLDDFLGLKVALTGADIRSLGFEPPSGGVDIPPDAPLPAAIDDAQAQLVSGVSQLEEALSRGNKMLQSFQAAAARDRNEDLGFFGGVENDPRIGPGYGDGTDETDAYFQRSFEMLANKAYADKQDELLSTVLGGFTTQRTKDQFMRYVDDRTARAAEYGLPLGDLDGVKYRTPEEFRDLLGLNAGG